MSWYLNIYLFVLLLFGVLGVIDNLKQSNKVFYVAGSIITIISCSIFSIKYFHPDFIGLDLSYIIILFSISLVFEIISTRRDILLYEDDEELSKKENIITNIIGSIVYVVVILPAFVFGFLSIMEKTNV